MPATGPLERHRDRKKAEPCAQDRVGPDRVLRAELRDDLADRQANREDGETGAPPGKLGPLGGEHRPSRSHGLGRNLASISGWWAHPEADYTPGPSLPGAGPDSVRGVDLLAGEVGALPRLLLDLR